MSNGDDMHVTRYTMESAYMPVIHRFVITMIRNVHKYPPNTHMDVHVRYNTAREYFVMT